MTCTITFTKLSVEQLKGYEKQSNQEAIDCLFNYFLKIANGRVYPDLVQSLPGKFKPSWETPFLNSPLKASFLKIARECELHHYHFGYRFYKEGCDEAYQGKVSDGIVHIRVYRQGSSSTELRIIKICLEHPSPFQIPFENMNDEAQETL